MLGSPGKADTTKPKIVFFGFIFLIISVLYFGVIREDSDIVETKDYMKRDLQDPDSAEFKNIRKVFIDGKLIICGEMNAKNAYGAYTGYKGFRSLGVGGVSFHGECR